ncbi:MAG: twin-arginine translocase TatA/TatE family subunit [Proteobacteria bacterium]|nr:twin-arginine translocase TatA/TatE family subunit [Pseudomonadota bacterium]
MSIGFWQIILILLIVLIVFGSGKLPKVMEDLAKGIKSFRDGMNLEDHPPHQEKSGHSLEKLPSYKKKKGSSSKVKKP